MDRTHPGRPKRSKVCDVRAGPIIPCGVPKARRCAVVQPGQIYFRKNRETSHGVESAKINYLHEKNIQTWRGGPPGPASLSRDFLFRDLSLWPSHRWPNLLSELKENTGFALEQQKNKRTPHKRSQCWNFVEQKTRISEIAATTPFKKDEKEGVDRTTTKIPAC